jgi:hypothetical protein
MSKNTVNCNAYTRSPAEIQTPPQWHLISCSLTAPPPVVLPSSILQPLLSNCTFHKEKIWHFSKMLLKLYIFLFLILKLTTYEFAKPEITLSPREVSVIAT